MRKYPPIEARFWANVDKLPGIDACWLWKGRSPTLVWNNQQIYAHHLSYQLSTSYAVGEDHCVKRTCGNNCVRPKHLELFQQKGTCHPRAKLAAEQVREIRRRYKEGVLVLSLAKEFGVSSPTISKIANRRSYKDVE